MSVPVRHTARLIILDPAGRVLLLRYRASRDIDPTVPGQRSFWFTPGGGIEPGEIAEQAALREMAEEVGLTGIPLSEEVARRTALNDLFERVAICHERYFLVRSPTTEFDTTDLAATDQDPVDEVRWWNIDELMATDTPVIPATLTALIKLIVTSGPPAAPIDLG